MEYQPPAIPNHGDHNTIFELAHQVPLCGSADAQTVSILYDIDSGTARCHVSSVLGAKYGTASAESSCSISALSSASSLQSSKTLTSHNIASAGLAVTNEQQVVSVTDRVLGHQVWYNRERSRKPQTFTQVWRPGLYVNMSTIASCSQPS